MISLISTLAVLSSPFLVGTKAPSVDLDLGFPPSKVNLAERVAGRMLFWSAFLEHSRPPDRRGRCRATLRIWRRSRRSASMRYCTQRLELCTNNLTACR